MCMEIRDNTLYFDGCDTTALAQTYGTPLYVYCYSGARSGQAAAALRRMGYTNVKNIGGIASWRGAIER